jgi:hypothetical protein
MAGALFAGSSLTVPKTLNGNFRIESLKEQLVVGICLTSKLQAESAPFHLKARRPVRASADCQRGKWPSSDTIWGHDFQGLCCQCHKHKYGRRERGFSKSISRRDRKGEVNATASSNGAGSSGEETQVSFSDAVSLQKEHCYQFYCCSHGA